MAETTFRLKGFAGLKIVYRFWQALRCQCHFRLPAFAGGVAAFLGDYRMLRRRERNPHFALAWSDLVPCLTDRTVHTPLEPIYFYQDTWAAGKIAQLRPTQHYDVGSSAMSIGVISRFVPVTMVDIRPLELKLDTLSFREGSILKLPFADGSIASLSSLCVVEHIGLGRYGDPIDPWGSEKAARELERVLAMGGNLFFSVPVDSVCRIYFNAHRAFTRDYVLEMFAGLKLVEDRYVYGTSIQEHYDPSLGFGTGLFHFTKVLP